MDKIVKQGINVRYSVSSFAELDCRLYGDSPGIIMLATTTDLSARGQHINNLLTQYDPTESLIRQRKACFCLQSSTGVHRDQSSERSTKDLRVHWLEQHVFGADVNVTYLTGGCFAITIFIRNVYSQMVCIGSPTDDHREAASSTGFPALS